MNDYILELDTLIEYNIEDINNRETIIEVMNHHKDDIAYMAPPEFVHMCREIATC